jgi:hypothetical protein
MNKLQDSMKKNMLFIPILLAMMAASLAYAQASINSDLENLATQHPDFVQAYSLISVTNSWKRIIDSEVPLTPVKIGISDTGIDAGHPEFAGTLVGTNRVGVVDLGQTSPFAKFDIDPLGHGTQVAGIIGANNLLGLNFPLSSSSPQMNGVLSGVPSLRYSLEVHRNLFTDAFSLFGSIKNLADKNVKIINLSYGEEKPNNIGALFLWDFFNDQFRKTLTHFSNITFVVAAGGQAQDVENVIPANSGDLANVITVTGTDLDDRRDTFSNFGPKVAIAAPGLDVYSPAPSGKGNFPLDTKEYDRFFTGSSAAAPLVTGVAGLIKAIKPALTPAEIKAILTKTANTDPVITDPDKPIGRRLNALKAVCDPQVLTCDTATPLLPLILHATDFVEFVNDNTTAGEIKVNNTLYLGTNNVHYGDVATTMLLSYGSNSRIIGNVGYNQLSLYSSPFPTAEMSTPPAITGIVTTPIPTPHVVIPVISLFPVGTTAATIVEDTTLLPGNYGNILVTNGATLTLLNGIYNVDTLLYFNPDTSLRFTVGTVMNVNGAFFASARVRVLPVLEGSSARLPITAGNIMLIQGNTVSADLLASCCVLMVNDNVVQGSMRGGFIDGNFRNRINTPSLPTVSALRVMSPSYPTRTTAPLDTLNWMEDNTMSALVHTNMATTTRMKIREEFQKARAVLKNN